MQTAALPQKRDERTTSGRDSPDEADAWLFAPYLRLMSWTFDPVACLACWFNDKLYLLIYFAVCQYQPQSHQYTLYVPLTPFVLTFNISHGSFSG